jgi:hypothetical protein
VAELERIHEGLGHSVVHAAAPAPADPTTLAAYRETFPGRNGGYWHARSISEIHRSQTARR